MAIIKCPECGNNVSDRADNCIHCGCSLSSNSKKSFASENHSKVQSHTHSNSHNKGKFSKKKPIYLRWWFIVPAIIALLVIVLAIMPKGEKIVWDDMALGEMLPEPPAGRGDVYDNGRDELDITILDGISDKQYNDYVTQCENMGFNVDVLADTYSYEAHNTDGYKLRLSHSSYDENLRIHLTAPIEMGEIQWPVGTIGSILPKPNSAIGKVDYESDDVFRAYIGDITENEYFEYIATCADNGFNVEISKQDRWYRVENAEGWGLILEYEGFNIMKIDITAPDEDSEDDATITEIWDDATSYNPTTTVPDIQETQEQSEESKNLQSAIEIEKAYTSLLHDMDSRNPSTFSFDADYVDGSDYFLELKRDVLELRDELEIYNDLTLVEEKYANIFGQKPVDVEQAKNTTNKLIENLCLETEQGEYFHINLDGILNHIMHYTDYVIFYINQDAGYMVIAQPHFFLEEKNLSATSFSKMLLLMRDFGAEIERKNEKIEIRWSNWDRAIGYYYCSNDAQYIKAKEAMDNFEYVIEADGFYVEEMELDAVLTISNIPSPDEVECILIYSLLEDKNGALINGYYNLISELNGNSTTIRYTYTGVELDSFEHEYINQTFSYGESFVGAMLYKNET